MCLFHRGLKAALIEREDFASGTSSKSTKLVHGGVRYLEKAGVWPCAGLGNSNDSLGTFLALWVQPARPVGVPLEDAQPLPTAGRPFWVMRQCG